MNLFDDDDDDRGLNGTLDRLKNRAKGNYPSNTPTPTPTSGRTDDRTFFEKHVGLCIGGVIFFLVAMVLAWSMCTTVVPAGHVGVQNEWGVVKDEVLEPGLHIKSPFVDVEQISTRTSVYNAEGNQISTFQVLSRDGVPVTVGIAVNYHIDPKKAPDLIKTVGTNYENIIMLNPIHTVPRDVIAQYDTQALFSAGQSESNPDRIKITQDVYNGISKEILNTDDGTSRGIIIEQIFLRNINLPTEYTNSATAKKVMEQQIQTAQYEVQKVQMEAQSKVAKAEGEAQANKILTESLTPELLKYSWIQSMKDNPKAIYVPVDSSGSPSFILTKDVESAAA